MNSPNNSLAASVLDGNFDAPRRAIETAYLKQLKASHRARARDALRWRPQFLRALAKCSGFMSALKAAGVCYNTVRSHERNDPEFAAQVQEADQEGKELFHAVCWKEALEGHLEPVFWQGNLIGEIRKFDSRLRIELLRAHMPDVFATPGARANVNATNQVSASDQIICDAATLQKLQEMRRESLRRMAASKEAIGEASNEADMKPASSSNAAVSGQK